jgi:hypothetical protein
MQVCCLRESSTRRQYEVADFTWLWSHIFDLLQASRASPFPNTHQGKMSYCRLKVVMKRLHSAPNSRRTIPSLARTRSTRALLEIYADRRSDTEGWLPLLNLFGCDGSERGTPGVGRTRSGSPDSRCHASRSSVRRDPQNQEGLAGQNPGVTGCGHNTFGRERRRVWDTKKKNSV